MDNQENQEKKDKGVFRKDFIDLVAILPLTEGKVEFGKDNYTTISIPLSMVTDIDKMFAVFRQVWVTLAKADPTLSKLFETYFRNQEIERKRIEKLLNKMLTRGDKKKQAKLEKKLKEYESKQENQKSSDDQKASD